MDWAPALVKSYIRAWFVQANLMCTTVRVKKLIVGLVTVAVVCAFSLSHYITQLVYNLLFMVVVPLTVLVVNVMLIHEMRRATDNAAANLGLQHHQSFQTAVPTITVVATSLVYVLLLGSWGIAVLMLKFNRGRFVIRINYITGALSRSIFAYNFFVYLITDEKFRSDLRTLFCRRSFSSCFSSVPAAAAVAQNCNDIVPKETESGQPDTAL